MCTGMVLEAHLLGIGSPMSENGLRAGFPNSLCKNAVFPSQIVLKLASSILTFRIASDGGCPGLQFS